MTNLAFDVIWRDHGAERGMKNLGDRTDRVHRGFRALKVAAGAAMLAVGVAATKFGIDSVRAYAEAEQSQLRLSEAYRKFPKLADTSIGSLRNLNTELAKKTRFDDDATASGQAVLAQFNLTGKQITQLTPLLQDYAAKTGKDLPTAARDLGKAVLGQGRSLKSVGINFKDTGNQGKNLEQITKGLRTQVGGFAEKEGKTAAGQAEILKNQWGEVQEAVGSKLLPMLVKLAGWVSTHQADLIGMFVHTAKGGIEFGIALARVVSGGLRGFGALSDGIGSFTAAQVDNLARFLHAATLAFGWIPGIGPRLVAADVKFSLFAANAHTNIHKTGDAVRGMADRIDAGLIPTLQRAGHKVDEFGRKEISSARQRDAANRARIAIERIGKEGDYARLKLKGFNLTTDQGSREQREFRGRVDAARAALHDQYNAARQSGASQNTLNRILRTGRDRLVDQYQQMGATRKQAERLADQVVTLGRNIRNVHGRKVPVDVHFTTNAGSVASRMASNVKSYAVMIRKNTYTGGVVGFGSQGMHIRRSGGGVMPGYTPGRDVHSFYSPTAGQLDLSGGEAIMRPEWTRAVGGPGAVARMNADARNGRFSHGFAGGGVVPSFGSINAATLSARPLGLAAGRALARAVAGELNALSKQSSGEGITGPVGGMTSFHGGRFTQLAAANLRRAEQLAGVTMHIMQGGWRPATSYSGTSHAGDAVDTQPSARLIRAIRAVGWASGDRTGLGNWAGHAHSVPSPSTGRARGSAVWQYQDYRRRGGASQGLGSPWGLASGGLLTARVAEEGPERLLDAKNTRTFDRMVRVMDARGVTGTTIINISAPNYIGSRDELQNAMVKMASTGKLDVVLKKAGVLR